MLTMTDSAVTKVTESEQPAIARSAINSAAYLDIVTSLSFVAASCSSACSFSTFCYY